MARRTVLAVCVAAFLAVSGAFGTDGAPFALRLAYWVALMLLGSLLSLGVQRAVERSPGAGVGRLAAGLVIGLTVLMTPLVFGATRWVFGGPWTWAGLAGTAPLVFVVSLAMTGLNLLAMRAREAGAAPPDRPLAAGPPPPVAGARFRERLPVRLRSAEVWAVEAEDHYLRVHTDRGSDLLLLRLADALEELAGVEGARTHRSWWVARAAVRDARRADGRATLVLPDGTEAPVSRSYAPALREAGWF